MKEINKVIRNFISKVIAGSVASTLLLSLSACSSTENTTIEYLPDETTTTQTTETTTEETTTEGPHDPYLKVKKTIAYDKDGYTLYRYEYEYDQYGNEIKLIEINEDNSKSEYVTMYEYNANKQITKMRILFGGDLMQVTEYQYNGNGDSAKVLIYYPNRQTNTFDLTYTTEYIYDDNNNLIKINTYDAQNTLISYYEYEYNDKGQEISEKQFEIQDKDKGLELLAEEKSEYDSEGNKIKTIFEMGTLSYTKEFEYNSKGQVIKETIIDLQEETEYEYDDKGNVIREITYDRNHNVEKRTENEYIYG